MRKVFFSLILFPLFLVLSGCTKINMFSYNKDFENYQFLLEQNEPEEEPIRTGDKFSISVWNHEKLSIGSIYGIYNSNEIFGKWQLVKSDSSVTLPRIGKVFVVGMTISEAEKHFVEIYKKFILDPVVTIQIHSHTIDILGQVKNPGPIVLFHHKHTLIEALSEGGGYTDYAKIGETKLVRNGVGYKIDLTRISPEDLSKLYVKSGDLIFLPSKFSKNIEQKTPILLAFASVLTALLILFRGGN